MILALVWTVLSLFLAVTIWRNAREHTRPQLGYSTRDNYRETVVARFIRKMSLTASFLCVLSAVMIWSSFTAAVLCLLAIPAVAAFQIFKGKKSIEGSANRSLPPLR